MAYFFKPEKNRIPPSGMPKIGDVGVRPGNVILPSYYDMYCSEVPLYHRNFRMNQAVVEVARKDTKAYIHPEFKAELSGDISDTEARNVKFYTETPELGGFLIRTNAHYAIYDSDFKAFGNGRNDFIGNGALVMTDDYAQAVIRNCTFETTGCVRPCTAAGLKSVMKVYESRLVTNGGEWPPDYKFGFAYDEGTFGHKRGDDDNGTGMGGNCRPHMSLNSSKAYFYDSEVISDGWAALSTDSVHGDLYLEANRCHLKLLHNGYSSWSDTGATVVYNDCDVDCAALLYVVTGEASITINNSRSKSGRYGVNMSTNANDKPTTLGQFCVNGGSFHTGREVIRISSQNAYITFDGVDLKTDNGILLHSKLNEHPRTAYPREDEPVYGVKAVYRNMDIAGDIIHEDPNRTMAITLIGTVLHGRIQDAYLALEKDSRWYATADSFVGLVGDVKLSQIDASDGVVINAVGADCPLHGTYNLPSGGKLVID